MADPIWPTLAYAGVSRTCLAYTRDNARRPARCCRCSPGGSPPRAGDEVTFGYNFETSDGTRAFRKGRRDAFFSVRCPELNEVI